MAKKKKKSISEEDAAEFLDEKLGPILSKEEKFGYESLSKPEKMILLIVCYHGGVRNGTIGSFLGNNLGRHVVDLIGFLREVGAGAVAKDLDEVYQHILSFCPGFPKDSFIQKLDEIPPEQAKKHYELNRERSSWLFEYDPDILQLLYAYLQK